MAKNIKRIAEQQNDFLASMYPKSVPITFWPARHCSELAPRLAIGMRQSPHG